LDAWGVLVGLGVFFLPLAAFVFYHALTEGRQGRRWAGLAEPKHRSEPKPPRVAGATRRLIHG
jgi:hypothetical protein